MRLSSSSMPLERSVVGTLWSATARWRRAAGPAAAGHAQALEGLGAGHLVHQVAVDVDQAGPVVVATFDQVGSVPDLVEQRSSVAPSYSRLARPLAWRPRASALGGGARLRARPLRCLAGRAGGLFPRSAPTCRCGRADNRAWPASRRRGAPAGSSRSAGCRAGRHAPRPRRRRSCAP